MRRLYLVLCLIVWGASAVFGQTRAEFQTMLSEINADSIRATVQTLENFTSRLATRGNRDVAEYIVERMQRYGIEDAVVDSFHVSSNNWLVGPIEQYMYNAKGNLVGSEHPDSVVIIGAHHDCIAANTYYSIVYDTTAGADDNASGVAVMLEIARVFQLHNFVPRYTISFVTFDGEELGLFGSHADAEQRYNSGEKVSVMLNNDMVASDPDNEGIVRLYWYYNAEDLHANAVLMCDSFTTLTPRTMDDNNNNEMNQRSDSYAYYLYGFKPVFAIEDHFSDYYHTPMDNTERYNYDYAAEVAKMNMALLMHYSYADVFSLPTGVSERENLVVAPVVSPNPTCGELGLSFFLNEGEHTRVSLYNLAGQQVAALYDGWKPAGFQHLEFGIYSVPAGIYFCKIQTTRGDKSVKVIKR